MAILNGTNARDIINGTNSADKIRGFRGDDELVGLNGKDRLFGGADQDVLFGDNGNDVLIGGAGDDFLIGGAGNDRFNGTDTPQEDIDQSGFDVADYSRDGGGSGVTVNLATGTATDSHGNTDTHIDIEAVIGTAFADSLTGGNPDNDGLEDFRGLAGDDIIDGGSGSDRVNYSNDLAHGGEMGVVVNLATGTARDGFGDTDTLIDIELVRATVFSDDLTGSGGDNRFEPLGGSDHIDGGGGTDTVIYFRDHFFRDNGNAITGIRADLALGQIVDTSGFHIDTVVSIENVGGSLFGDEIRGNGRANTFVGFDGDDFLLGRGGDDRLGGGTGHDILRGGVGEDQLIGDSGDDFLVGGAGHDVYILGPGSDHDRVRFEDGLDLLVVSEYGYASGDEVVALAVQQGNHVVIANGEDSITLLNFDLADLDSGDFFV